MSTGISIASLVVSVITLALVLMLLAGKPWESSPVETVLTAIPPGYAGRYYEKGREYYNDSEYSKAWEQYTKAIEIDPDYAVAYKHRATASANLDRYEDAIADYDKAIELDPNDGDAYYNRGRDYSELGQYQNAWADKAEACSLNSKYC